MRVMQQSNETADMKANGMTVVKVKGRKIWVGALQICNKSNQSNSNTYG
jgi:hypothetical protein